MEKGWADFILQGPAAMGDVASMTEDDWAQRAAGFELLPGETLAGVLPATTRWPGGPTSWPTACPT